MPTGYKIDLKGRKFGYLYVKNFSHIQAYPDRKLEKTVAFWQCICKCGAELVVAGKDLRRKHRTSCGCKRKEGNLKQRKPTATFFSLYRVYERSAAARNLKFSITFKDAVLLFKQPCYYCNVSPFRIWKSKVKDGQANEVYNGIDRIDNTKGYIKNNVVPSCTYCNYAKRDRTVKDFLNWVDQIHKYHKL